MTPTIKETAERPEEIRTAWSQIAAGYDEFVTTSHLWLGNEGLRRAGLRSGMRFLDVAAGTGALSIPAARLGASVVSTDISPAMLEQLQARARKEGLEIETRVMDGHSLEFDDDTFDVAGSQFGVMLFPDMPKGVSELARVVKPGGRVLMNVFGDPQRVEFLVFFVRAVQSVRPEFTGPLTDPPLPFQLRDPNRLREALAAVGLSDITVDCVTEPMEFRNGKALWDSLISSNPIVESILRELNLTNDERALIRKSLEKLIRERAGRDDKAVLTNPINIGVGTK